MARSQRSSAGHRTTKRHPPRSSSRRSVLDSALRRLAARDRSENELRSGLLRSGYRSPEVSETLDRLRQLGLLDDEAFAERYSSRGLRLRSEGPRHIRLALKRRGVTHEKAAAGLERAMRETNEETVIAALAHAYWRRKTSQPPLRRLASLYTRLVRRGFSPARIVTQLRRMQPNMHDLIDEMQVGFDPTSGEDD